MSEPTMPVPASWFRREWVCKVVESGYHNGAHCSPNDPHSLFEWGCGYYWRASFSDQRWNTLQKQLRMEKESRCESGE